MSEIMYYYDIEQGTDEWFEARLGIVTASEVNNLVTPTGKLASGSKVQAYACELASQRVNMQIEDTFQSFDMMRGHFQEDIARGIYDENYGEVTECGFITRDLGGVMLGCSPDGLVGSDGGIEIKSRLAKFQVSTIVADAVPNEYVNQLQAFLLATGRDWVDFVQYSNGMPMFVKRVTADETRQNTIIKAIIELEALIEKVQGIYSSTSDGLIQTERVEFVIDDMVTPSETEGE